MANGNKAIATVSKGRKTVCIVVEQKKLLWVIRSGLVGRTSPPTIESGFTQDRS
jgi:hypothetical protein